MWAAEKGIPQRDKGASEKGIAEIWGRQRRELQREMGTAEKGNCRETGGSGEGDNGDGDEWFFLQSKCQQEQG
jgi:hypothetical protein